MSQRPSTHRLRDTSRRMRQAEVKTHVRAGGSTSRGSSPTARVRRAERGELHQMPVGAGGGTHARRKVKMRPSQGPNPYTAARESRRRGRMVAICALLVVLVAAAACAVATLVYLNGINSRIVLSDDDLAEALADTTDDDTGTYVLLCASFDDDDAASDPDAILLVRLDADAACASVVAIPSNTQVTLSDSSTARLGEARALGGDAELVEAVEDLIGVEISHIITADAEGFVALIDALGGIEVELPCAISDAEAGSIALAAGSQTLSGAEALFACRADEYVLDVAETRGEIAASVARGIFERISELGTMDFYRVMDDFADYIQTDMGVRAAANLLDEVRAIAEGTITTGALPTSTSTSDDIEYEVASSDDVAEMLERIVAGKSPQASIDEILSAFTASDYTVLIYNGGGVTGAAGYAYDELSELGFSVTGTGNTTMQVYDETLVIYADSDTAEVAEAIVEYFGVGRALQDTVHYSFSTDIYMVVGADWEYVFDAEEQASAAAAAAAGEDDAEDDEDAEDSDDADGDDS